MTSPGFHPMLSRCIYAAIFFSILVSTARAQTRPDAVDIRFIPNDAVRWKSFLQQDDFGFTIFPKAEDRQFVFMSSTDGDDANDGRTEDTPIRTLLRAINLMRDGYPDRLLLKRGDTFRNKNFNTVFSRGGRSLLEPMMIGAYGDPRLPRPVIACNLALGGRHLPNFLVIEDLDFYADLNDPTAPTYDPHAPDAHQAQGINMLSPGKYMWIENCRFRFFGSAIELQTGKDRYHGLVLRRCIIADDFNSGAHSQGIYLYNVEDVLIEENLFDHNGWSEQAAGAGATIFNHNMYIQHGKWGENFNIIVRNNISARASSHGCQLRPGGVLENNLFLKNGLAAFVAYAPSVMRNNVVLGGTSIGKDNPRGKGLDVLNCPEVLVEGNIIAHKNDPVNTMAALAYQPIMREDPATDSRGEYRNNVVYDWTGAALEVGPLGKSLWVHDNYFDTRGGWLVTLNQFDDRCRFDHNHYLSDGSTPFAIGKTRFDFQDWSAGTADSSDATPADFVDPSRDIAGYAASIGLKDATLEGFLNAARQNCRGHWDNRLTAAAVNDYIRAGFALKHPEVPPGAP